MKGKRGKSRVKKSSNVKSAASSLTRGRGAISNVGGGKKSGGFMGYNPVAHNPGMAPMPFGTF